MPATGIISLSAAHTNGHNSIATLYHSNHQWYIFHHHHPVLIHHNHHHHARGHNSIATLDCFILFIFERVPGLGLQLKHSLPSPPIPTTLEYQKRISWRRRKICLQLHFPTAGNRFHTAVLWYMPRQPHRISHIHHHCQQQHRHNLQIWPWPVFSPGPGMDRGAKNTDRTPSLYNMKFI